MWEETAALAAVLLVLLEILHIILMCIWRSRP